MDQYNKEQFAAFIKKCVSGDMVARKEMYNFLVECFKTSDVNLDGSIDPVEFDQMIEAAAAAPRRHGFAPATTTLYKTPEDRLKARKDVFVGMDENKDGQISLDEWIGYCVKHIQEKAKAL